MPTRCLKVDNLAAISLCITKAQECPYAALSYCWGPKEFPNLVTTRTSLENMLENIPLPAFPPTLRDGILVAHQLGIRYLWIDALCIIQDDEDDKDNEIPQMRRIFSNAHCTIIAATASHCHAGFLHHRELPNFDELLVPFPGPGATAGHMILRKHDPDEWILYDPLEDPVNDRAWTLEERLLSPRRLIYSQHHLRWLCETVEATNGGDPEERKFASQERRGQMERLPPQLSPRINLPTDATDTVSKDDKIWYAWLSIVREYNLRSLTKPKDKLRAIGGIADLYQLKTGDQYCAGLWRSHLAEELLWKVFHPRASFSTMMKESKDPASTAQPSITLFKRPKHRAPTWSWASVDGTAANHRALTRSPFIADVFKVLECVVVPEKPNAPLTGVRSAVLTVRGRMKRAYLDTRSWSLYGSEAITASMTARRSAPLALDGSTGEKPNSRATQARDRHVPDASAVLGFTRLGQKCDGWQQEESFGTCNIDALEHDPFPELRPVHCLEITSRIRDGFEGNQQGLVLVGADAEETFQRIGMFGTELINASWFQGVSPRIVRII